MNDIKYYVDETSGKWRVKLTWSTGYLETTLDHWDSLSARRKNIIFKAMGLNTKGGKKCLNK